MIAKRQRNTLAEPLTIALDTETTGLHLHHGCRPFFVSTTDSNGENECWEWDVDPLTRRPIIPKGEREQIRKRIAQADTLVFHNTKFDVRALLTVGVLRLADLTPEFWAKVNDTHIASHVLHSGQSHKLKDQALLALDIPDDDLQALREAVNDARRYGRKNKWRIATKGDWDFPFANAPKDGWWLMDFWLPRAAAKAQNLPKRHPWWTVLSTYGATDSERTILLWLHYQQGLNAEGLWEQYEQRRRLLGVVFRMEQRGITLQRSRVEKQLQEFEQERLDAARSCIRISGGTFDNINSTKQVSGVLTTLGIPVASTAAPVLRAVQQTIKRQHPANAFIRNLLAARRYGKGREYLEAYRDTALPVGNDGAGVKEGKLPPMRSLDDWLVLRPSFNICGTSTTRFSSSDPNAQNISKKEEINLRDVFGPLPGREWYAIDYSNIELRIFAYAAKDHKLIAAFERGESVHLLFAKVLYPKEYAACERDGVAFNDRYKDTLYQWVKNGNFALIYGAGEAHADATYRVHGAYRTIRKKMPLIDKFMSQKYQEAKRLGYITTLGGYRLDVPMDKPHAAVNYFVQGTAGWCMVLAMNAVDEYLRTLPGDYQIIMTIHDELVLDFPKHRRNKKVLRKVVKLMEDSGRAIGLPTPVEPDHITTTWAAGKAVQVA